MAGLKFSSIKTVVLNPPIFHTKKFTYSLKTKARYIYILLAVGNPHGCDSGEQSHTVPWRFSTFNITDNYWTQDS